MAKLGVNIVGGPNPSDIRVINAETGEEIKGIIEGTINVGVNGLTATITLVVNHLDVKIDEIQVRETAQTDKANLWKYTEGTVKFTPKDYTIPNSVHSLCNEPKLGDSWT